MKEHKRISPFTSFDLADTIDLLTLDWFVHGCMFVMQLLISLVYFRLFYLSRHVCTGRQPVTWTQSAHRVLFTQLANSIINSPNSRIQSLLNVPNTFCFSLQASLCCKWFRFVREWIVKRKKLRWFGHCGGSKRHPGKHHLTLGGGGEIMRNASKTGWCKGMDHEER